MLSHTRRECVELVVDCDERFREDADFADSSGSGAGWIGQMLPRTLRGPVAAPACRASHAILTSLGRVSEVVQQREVLLRPVAFRLVQLSRDHRP